MSQVRELIKHTAVSIGYAASSAALVYQTYDYIKHHRALRAENAELRETLKTTQQLYESARKRWW